MRTKMSLIAAAAMALALMGFASSAMAATDGVVRDVTNNEIIPLNHELHFVGWARFGSGSGGMKCHVTAIAKATVSNGTTGQVTNFSIPDTTKCTGDGGLAFCTLTGDQVTNLPYHLTATPTDFDVTGNIVIHNQFGGFCPLSEVTLEFSEITLKPLNTTNKRAVTNTAGNLGNTAAAGEPIAGVELSGSGSSPQVGAITAEGELELTAPDRCTWKLASS